MRWVLIALLRAYRAVVSPLYGPVCRYHPSCSAYALGAVTRHGALRGSWLAARRVVRCNPWSFGGYDPVPGTDPEHDHGTATCAAGAVRDDGARASVPHESEAVVTPDGELSTVVSHREAHP